MTGTRRVAWAGSAFLVGLALTQAGCCALLVPPSWRPRAPIPLAGPMPPPEAVASGEDSSDLTSLSDAQLDARLDAAREQLVGLTLAARDPGAGAGSEREMRELAEQLPLLQREKRARGSAGPGSRIRHPVIR